MNQKLTLILALLFSFSTAFAATFTGAGDGESFEDPNNWDTGVVPGSDEEVNIGAFFQVRISSNAVIAQLDLFDEGSLTIDAGAGLVITSQNSTSNAILMEDASTLINRGNVIVLSSESRGLFMEADCAVFNDGTIVIQATEDEDGIQMDGGFFDNNGILQIRDAGENGIDMNDDATFLNAGLFDIDVADTEGVNMDDDAYFLNEATGQYICRGVDGNDGICLDDNGVQWDNYGYILVDGVDGTGEGIEVDDGVFTNQHSGIIVLNGITGDGLKIQDDGALINDGLINIEQIDDEDGSEEDGIEIEDDATLINNNVINIVMNYLDDNNRVLHLEGDDAYFFNSECAVINITSNNIIENDGLIENDGVIAITSVNTHENNSDFENNGTIVAPNGFTVAPNALIGAGAIVAGNVPAEAACGLEENNVGCTGTTVQNGNSYTQNATGCYYTNPFNSDELSFASTKLCGNSEIIAEVSSIFGFGWAGIMMREDVAAGSKKAQLMTNGSYFVRREVRTMDNGPAYPQQFPSFGKKWLRLVRNGNFFFGYVSQNGTSWQQVFVQYINMSECIEVGITTTNGRAIPPMPVTAEFDNVEFGSNAPLVEQTPDLQNSLDLGSDERATAFEVFPNPTSGELNLSLLKYAEQDFNIEVFNAVGQSVKRFEYAAGTDFETINLNGLPQGMYHITLTTLDGQRESKKIILE